MPASLTRRGSEQAVEDAKHNMQAKVDAMSAQLSTAQRQLRGQVGTFFNATAEAARAKITGQGASS